MTYEIRLRGQACIRVDFDPLTSGLDPSDADAIFDQLCDHALRLTPDWPPNERALLTAWEQDGSAQGPVIVSRKDCAE